MTRTDWLNLAAVVLGIGLLVFIVTVLLLQYRDILQCEEQGGVPVRIARYNRVLCLEPGAIRK